MSATSGKFRVWRQERPWGSMWLVECPECRGRIIPRFPHGFRQAIACVDTHVAEHLSGAYDKTIASGVEVGS